MSTIFAGFFCDFGDDFFCVIFLCGFFMFLYLYCNFCVTLFFVGIFVSPFLKFVSSPFLCGIFVFLYLLLNFLSHLIERGYFS